MKKLLTIISITAIVAATACSNPGAGDNDVLSATVEAQTSVAETSATTTEPATVTETESTEEPYVFVNSEDFSCDCEEIYGFTKSEELPCDCNVCQHFEHQRLLGVTATAHQCWFKIETRLNGNGVSINTQVNGSYGNGNCSEIYERLNLAEKAVEFLINLDIDYENTFKQIRSPEDPEWLDTWFNKRTITGINQANTLNALQTRFAFYVRFSESERYGPICVEFVEEDGDLVVYDVYSYME